MAALVDPKQPPTPGVDAVKGRAVGGRPRRRCDRWVAQVRAQIRSRLVDRPADDGQVVFFHRAGHHRPARRDDREAFQLVGRLVEVDAGPLRAEQAGVVGRDEFEKAQAIAQARRLVLRENQGLFVVDPVHALHEGPGVEGGDEDPGVRAACVTALGRHGDTVHAPYLIDAMNDEDDRVRLAGARALQRVHSREAVAPLLNALKAEDEE
ncbi:MAG: HEAT repeat domain-containing protein, partial [Phycisphaeraceae bacterium]